MFNLIRTTPTARFVLCLDGEFHLDRHVGVKVGMTAKTWATEAGANRYAAKRWNVNEPYCKAEAA